MILRWALAPVAYALGFAVVLVDRLLGTELPELLELNDSESTITEIC